MNATQEATAPERVSADPALVDEWLDALERLETRAINLRADLQRFADRSHEIGLAVTAIREAFRDNTVEIHGRMDDHLRVLIGDRCRSRSTPSPERDTR